MNWFRLLLFFNLVSWLQVNCLGSGYSFSRVSIENGLSNNQVNAIFKDSYGYIWLGTIEGLDRFDGVEIRPFSFKFPEAVENVHTITEDLGNHLWVGTSTGLFRFDKKVDKFERIEVGEKNLFVKTLVILPDSNLCVGTSSGLFLVNTKTFQWRKILLNETSENQTNDISGILPDNSGFYWIATTNGLVRYSSSNNNSERFECQLLPKQEYNSFSTICSIGNKLYLGTKSVGLVEFDLLSKEFSKGINTGNKIILSISSDKKEKLFAATDGGGLKVINVRTKEVEDILAQENDPNSISSNSVYSFYMDEKGRFWIGTYSAGVCYSKNISGNFNIHNLTTNHPEYNKSIRSFYFSPDGTQYFGTRNGFIQVNKNGTSRLFQSNPGDKNGLRSNIILSIYPFGNDVLIGTYGGGMSLFSVSQQKIVPFPDETTFNLGNVYAFDTDKNGNLWISSFNGLYRYSPKDKSLINFNTTNSSLHNDQIFEIRFDSFERLWVGTMSGAFVYTINGDKLEMVNLPVIADNTFKTNYVYEDQSGNIWICTERGGLIEVDKELTRSNKYFTSDGLPDNSICAIIEANAGEYWISTLKGFCTFSQQSKKFTRYSMADGLPGLVFTPGATHKSKEGTLFFGNEKGLVYFNPKNLIEKSHSSKIQITDFYLSGKEVKPGNESVLNQIMEETRKIHLSSKQNNIGFRFISMNYSNPVDNEYAYKLEGFDEDWRNNGISNTVYYEKLKPGRYLFKVKNLNESDDEASKTNEVEIVIHRSIFSSPFFFIFLFIFTSAVVFIMVRYIKILQTKARKIFDLPQKPEKYKGSRIPKSQSDAIIAELKRHMEENKPYLNSELKLADLANDINYHVNEISQVLNQDLNQSFSDFVNKYRVEEVKRRMEDKAYEKFTFVAIAQQCGFNSKTSFYRIFKNETGKTPADYLKNLRPDHN